MPTGIYDHGKSKHYTEDERSAATVLFQSGASASDAADQFSREHRPMTRNAMIGLWHRMKLHRGYRQQSEAVRVPKRKRSEINRNGPDMNILRGIKRQLRAPKPVECVRVGVLNFRTHYSCDLFGLTNETCRWPIGDPGHPDFFFCGVPDADCDHGRPYCGGHTRIACGS